MRLRFSVKDLNLRLNKPWFKYRGFPPLFFLFRLTLFLRVRHSIDIQGTRKSGLRHNLPVARLRLTGGPTRGKRLDQREIWRDGLEEGKTLSSPANRPICSYVRRNARSDLPQ